MTLLPPPPSEAIHGSLLALGELLQHTGEFLLARWGGGVQPRLSSA